MLVENFKELGKYSLFFLFLVFKYLLFIKILGLK